MKLEATLTSRLADFRARLGEPSRYVVAYSGGLDSTVLLHLLVDVADVPVKAAHVNHRLHPESDDWARFCASAAAALGVEFAATAVEFDPASGKGLEAAAREARYRALEAELETGDWLLSAHHLDDQVETLLLNLLRGSGPDGLAAMPWSRPLGHNWLLRPFLDVPRSALERSARARALRWIDDPSNAEPEQDRNYLRHRVLPVIRERWPDAPTRLEQSVRRSAEAASLLRELAEADLDTLGTPAPGRIALAGLRQLSDARQAYVVRAVVRQLGLPPPPATALEAIRSDLLDARPDAEPVVKWQGAEARRFADTLHLMPTLPPAPENEVPIDTDTAELPAGLGRLRFSGNAASGLSPALVEGGLSVRWRRGGETLRCRGRSRSLKKLLNEARVLPWMRDRVPLVYAGGQLVAVADLFLADGALASPGLTVRWDGAPAIR